MFRKNKKDDRYIPEEDPAGQDAWDGEEEEQDYSFDEEYEGDASVPEEEMPEEEEAPEQRPAPARRGLPLLRRRPAAAKRSQEDRPARREKKGRKRRRQEQLDIPERVVREAPTVGRELKSNQMLVYDSELDEVDYTDPEDLPEGRDYLPIRFRRYGRSGLGGGVLYALCVISISIVLASFGWMCAVDVLALNKEAASAVVEILPYEPTGDMPTTVTVKNDDGELEEVPIKVDIDQVADTLKDNGIIEYKWLFKIFARISNANIKMDPGVYDLNTSYDYRALVTKMQFGSDSQETTQVTFPEGFSMDQIFTLLEQNYVCKKDELYDAAANYDFDYDFLEGIPLGEASRLEGFLFPDTYEFYRGEPAETAINRFLRNTDNKLSDEVMDGIAQRGLTVREAIIMASLIEKEAGSGEGERENMASVIYNRLNANMPLGLDSTINYIKGTSTFDLTADDLQIDSPYNTYLYPGLPIGPICNPGLASIKAVIDPASTGYYYWYSVDGVSYFFASHDEQLAFANSH